MKSNTTHEAAIALAIEDLIKGTFTSIRKAAAAHGVPRATLGDRYAGRSQSRAHVASTMRRTLTDEQEEALCVWIADLTRIGLAPAPVIVRQMVERITGAPVSSAWCARFTQRHPDLATGNLARIDKVRVQAEDPEVIQGFFDRLQHARAEYGVLTCNTYNFDEKGFMLGLGHATKRMYSKQAMRNEARAAQDGNREMVSVIACICADGSHLPPLAIYKGKNLQHRWFTELSAARGGFCTVSETGWSNNKLAYLWLSEVFEPGTRLRAAGAWRLLIMDSHASHVCLDFYTFALEHRIMLLRMPPHCTHLLQPLDVSVFHPLGGYFAREVDLHMLRSQGLLPMTKALFWEYFMTSWEAALNMRTVRSAWKNTGIHPFNPQVVLGALAVPEAVEAEPPTAAAVRSAQRTTEWHGTPCTKKRGKQFSDEILALRASNEVLLSRVEGLCASLTTKKRLSTSSTAVKAPRAHGAVLVNTECLIGMQKAAREATVAKAQHKVQLRLRKEAKLAARERRAALKAQRQQEAAERAEELARSGLPLPRPRGRPIGSKNKLKGNVAAAGSSAAEPAPKRARGRPKGSMNKKPQAALIAHTESPEATEPYSSDMESSIGTWSEVSSVGSNMESAGGSPCVTARTAREALEVEFMDID
jgi:hypothetical protein